MYITSPLASIILSPFQFQRITTEGNPYNILYQILLYESDRAGPSGPGRAELAGPGQPGKAGPSRPGQAGRTKPGRPGRGRSGAGSRLFVFNWRCFIVLLRFMCVCLSFHYCCCILYRSRFVLICRFYLLLCYVLCFFSFL